MTIDRIRELRGHLRRLTTERVIVPVDAIVDLAQILDEVLTELGPSGHAQAVEEAIGHSLPLLKCDRCGRREYAIVGQIDRMTQPSGGACGGRFA